MNLALKCRFVTGLHIVEHKPGAGAPNMFHVFTNQVGHLLRSVVKTGLNHGVVSSLCRCLAMLDPLEKWPAGMILYGRYYLMNTLTRL